MAAVRRGSKLTSLDLSQNSKSVANNPPPISALFLIYFDIKAGYTISWKRALAGLELEGVVEYKSLPSGLHTVKQDLIYFVHDQYAGLSAFVNAPDAESSRNARMIAVGVLVPLSYGRLGRSWEHAEELKAIGQQLVLQPGDTQVLENYWEAHKAPEDRKHPHTESSSEFLPTIQPQGVAHQPGQAGHMRNRSASEGPEFLSSSHTLSSHHPAFGLQSLLATFGPLIFPIHRAAMLRKRILISCHAPVHQVCDFVYDLSLISNIPLAVSHLLSESAPPSRIRPLFTIGVHDIPLLEEDLKASKMIHTGTSTGDRNTDDTDPIGCGWIACTTDGILAVKDTLYDILITLPPTHMGNNVAKSWPLVQSFKGMEMKATQRDLRRYKVLIWSLSRLSQDNKDLPARRSSDESPSSSGNDLVDDMGNRDTGGIVMPVSWSAMAYTGFMWWASAGEHQITVDDEFENDCALLENLGPQPSSVQSGQSKQSFNDSLPTQSLGETANHEMAIITYFHRLTKRMITVLSEIADLTGSDDDRENALLRDDFEEGEEGPAMLIKASEVAKMGLDPWVETDREFIDELASLYFGKRADVEGSNVDICGIKVC